MAALKKKVSRMNYKLCLRQYLLEEWFSSLQYRCAEALLLAY